MWRLGVERALLGRGPRALTYGLRFACVEAL
jgi:hypothetical protein